MINLSEGDMLRQINEAKGRSEEIRLMAAARFAGIERIASAINQPGGSDAVSLRIAEQYVKEFGKLARQTNALILPAERTDIGSVVVSLSKALAATKEKH